MDLVHVKGNTYYLDSMTTLPVYKIDETRCILIDSGWSFERSGIQQALKENNLQLAAIIGTHAHPDHCGNHEFFREKYRVPIIMSEGEADLLYNHLSIKTQMYVFSPEEILQLDEFRTMPARSEQIIRRFDRTVNVAGVTFDVLHTPGHTSDHIALITPDGICCVGDAVMSEEVLENSKLPYHISVADAMESMELLRQFHLPAICSHKGWSEDLSKLAEKNIEHCQYRAKVVLQIINERMSMEEAVVKVCKELRLLSKKVFKVKIYDREVRNFMDYLLDQGKIRQSAGEGRIFCEPVHVHHQKK